MLNTVIGSSTIMYFFHFEYGRNHQNKSIEICSCNFCKAFYGTSFAKEIRILSFGGAEIFEKQTMLQTFCVT